MSLAQSWFGVGRPDLADQCRPRDYIDETVQPGDPELRRETARIVAPACRAKWTRRFTEWSGRII